MATASKSNKRRESDTDRKAKLEAMRKQQKAAARRSQLLWVAAGTAVVLVLVAIIGLSVNKKINSVSLDKSSAPTALTADDGTATTQAAVVMGTNDSGIDGVVHYTAADGGKLEQTHVTGPVTYAVTPPVGGPHNAVWMNCGVYTQDVPNERAVHNLEHGVVWITYQPTLPAADLLTLDKLVKNQKDVTIQGNDTGARYMDLTPYEGLDSPIVISAWGYQLKVTSASDPRLQQFITKFRVNQTLTPEYGALCNGEPANVSGTPGLQ